MSWKKQLRKIMKFLTIASDYTSFCIQDDFEGSIKLDQLGLPKDFIREINAWNQAYKIIIPLSEEERNARMHEIELLDQHGLEIAKKLQQLGSVDFLKP